MQLKTLKEIVIINCFKTLKVTTKMYYNKLIYGKYSIMIFIRQIQVFKQRVNIKKIGVLKKNKPYNMKKID